MLGFLQGQLWKAGAIGAGAAAIGLAVALGVTTLQKNAAVKRADGLYAEIHAPVSGYKARLTNCEGNERRLDKALADQNTAIADLRKTSDAKIAEAQRGFLAAQREAASARNAADRLAGAVPVGNTVCERLLDVDAMIKESFQ